MTKDDELKEALKRFSSNQQILTVTATVKSVDEDKATLSAEITDGLVISDVRLRSIIDGNEGAYVVPETNTKVLLLRYGSSDEFHCIGAEKYKKVVFKGQSISFEINQDEIIFNDNAKNSYLTDINKLVDKINALEQQINDLKSVFSQWVPVPQDGGASLKIASATWSGQLITPKTTVDDLKDEKVKH
jgi:hypothetical protein